MRAPQIIMIVVSAMYVGIGLAMHGQPKTGEHNFVVSLLGAVIELSILWWGGFFG